MSKVAVLERRVAELEAVVKKLTTPELAPLMWFEPEDRRIDWPVKPVPFHLYTFENGIFPAMGGRVPMCGCIQYGRRLVRVSDAKFPDYTSMHQRGMKYGVGVLSSIGATFWVRTILEGVNVILDPNTDSRGRNIWHTYNIAEGGVDPDLPPIDPMKMINPRVVAAK